MVAAVGSHARPKKEHHTDSEERLLKPEEEQWREVFDRLRERFPTVAPQKVAEVLRENQFHAGGSARILREMIGHGVKDADPDDSEHVKTLLSNPAVFKHACTEQFNRFDINGDGLLEISEILELTTSLYRGFGLEPPSLGSVQAFIHAMDENNDGVLDEREFRRFFEVFLRYAYFDVVKLRQIVERGRAHQEKSSQEKRDQLIPPPTDSHATPSHTGRNKKAGGSKSGSPRPEVEVEPHAEAEEGGQHAGHGRRPGASPCGRRRRAGGQPGVTFSPNARKVRASGMTTPASVPEGEEEQQGRATGSGSKSPSSERRRRSHESDGDGSFRAAPAPAFRCIAPEGVEYREAPDGLPPHNEVGPDGRGVQAGGTVQALEVWIRTPDGWLPVMDPGGQPLFQRRSDRAARRPSDTLCSEQALEATSGVRLPPSQNSKASHHRKVYFNDCLGVKGPIVVPTDATDMSCSQNILLDEETWQPAFERLCERFPAVEPARVLQAMRETEGHAGKTAALLRTM